MHIGIIMDGNRRWAKRNGKPTIAGHKQGFQTLKKILKLAKQLNISYVSVYAFSTENWKRSQEEVNGLMNLLKTALQTQLDDIKSEGIRIVFLGNRNNLDDKIVRLIENTEKETADNTNGTLAICFNYGGKQEVVDAAVQAIEENIDLSEKNIQNYLYHPEVPDVDILVRTGGEKRLSNFMMWRVQYAELFFSDTLWPDFSEQELQDICAEFARRNRRFGG
jgi:undecaprenyl diphosphate synthase